MEIKLKTGRAGILAFDLAQPEERTAFKRAQSADDVGFAIQDFFNKLRSIRKYEKYETVKAVNYEDMQAEIYMAEEYYRALLLLCLREREVEHFLEL